MKKKFLFIVLIMVFLSSCGGSDITCFLSVYSDEGIILDETEITVKEGQSVLDALKKITRDKRIPMEYSGTGITAYVKGIDNLYEFDKGPESGWIYMLNGETVQKGAGAQRISDGDIIIWQYILES